MEAPFPFFNNIDVKSAGLEVTFNGDLWDSHAAPFDEKTIKFLAFKYLNTSYLWGGKSVFGVDCSGFCQIVFKFLGLKLFRDAWQQALQGTDVGFLEEAMCGDLAFFDNEEGKITHVGILLDASTIIHSSGKVRVDSIDNTGIVGTTAERTHRLRIIKRMTQG